MGCSRTGNLSRLVVLAMALAVASAPSLQGQQSPPEVPQGAEAKQGPKRYRHRRQAGRATVAGRVVTPKGEPIPGAAIEIPELGLSATTDEKEEFDFDDLPMQRLSVTAQAQGYYPSAPLKIDLAAQPEYDLEIVLTERLLAQSVVVTGAASEYLAVDAPVRTQMLSGLQCERNVSRSLTEALTSTVSGVRVEYTCQNCGAPSVRLSGLAGNYTQILEDGLPTMSNVGMVYALDQLPPISSNPSRWSKVAPLRYTVPTRWAG